MYCNTILLRTLQSINLIELVLEEIEQKYLERNSKYYIENTLFNSLSVKEISEFIRPLHKEYKTLDKEIKNTIEETQGRYNNLDELAKYFIELLVKHEYGGDRLNELENLLNAFNNHLYTRLPSKKSYGKEFKNIDINDIPIAQVIGKYTKVPANLSRNMKCPIHSEKTGSFKIYKETNSFYCFGCQRGGNAINFISEIENISTKEAFKRFIDLFNL